MTTTRQPDVAITSIRLPKALHDEAKKVAEREDRTVSQLLRVALRHYLHDLESCQPA